MYVFDGQRSRWVVMFLRDSLKEHSFLTQKDAVMFLQSVLTKQLMPRF